MDNDKKNPKRPRASVIVGGDGYVTVVLQQFDFANCNLAHHHNIYI